MKRLYWRPHRASPKVVLFIAVAAVVALAIVQRTPTSQIQPRYETRLAAARLARQAMLAVGRQRQRLGYPVDRRLDPAGSGLIGLPQSEVTTVRGNLESKQTSVNPNFAAVIVDMLDRAGVREGALIAVGCSGSFPAMNIAVLAALQTMKARPVIIASTSSSQYGANLPDLTWLDMERLLQDRGYFEFSSVAASPGGLEDRTLRLSDEGRRLVRAAIKRNGVEFLASESFDQALQRRLQVYDRYSGGKPYVAYINIGGGSVSVGRSIGKKRYRPGLNLKPPPTATEIDSVMTRFANKGVPVVHLVEIRQLADRYALPIAPTTMPAVGQGDVFVRRTYNRWLAAAALIAILLLVRAFVLTDWGHRLTQFVLRRPDRESSDNAGDEGAASLMV
jgi:poly-gamma-glutamate system protein